LICNQ